MSRAIERLRECFAKRGVTVGAGGLAVVISANAVQAAPAGLAVTISGATLAAAAGGAGTILGLLKLMTMTKLQAAIIGAIVLGAVVTPLMMQHQAALRRENQSRREQLAQLHADNQNLANRVGQLRVAAAEPLPAPRVATVRATNLAALLSPYQQVTEFLESHRELPREQIEAYLRQNHRNVESLLAAFQVSRPSKNPPRRIGLFWLSEFHCPPYLWVTTRAH